MPSSLQCPRRPPGFLSRNVHLTVEGERKDCAKVKDDFELVAEVVGQIGRLGNDEVVKEEGRREVERQKEKEREREESRFVEEQKNMKLGETEKK